MKIIIKIQNFLTHIMYIIPLIWKASDPIDSGRYIQVFVINFETKQRKRKIKKEIEKILELNNVKRGTDVDFTE